MSNLSSVIAEISIVPIGTSDTSIGKEIAAAYDAIRNIKNLKKVTLTPMSTQVESDNLDYIFQAIHAAHDSAKSVGVKRVISTIRIDERLDKPNTLDLLQQIQDNRTYMSYQPVSCFACFLVSIKKYAKIHLSSSRL
jgi:uncharacterized protein (TIGR00106 family)